MLHYWSIDQMKLEGAWLTIGSFDGIHLGHQAVLKNLVQGAHSEGLPAVVLTFHPHPSAVLGKRQGAFYLSSPEQKAEILSGMGVDYLITHPFNRQVAGLSARQFIEHLHQGLRFRHLYVGPDFALGHNREGGLPELRGLGRAFSFHVEVTGQLEVDGRIVSSSWVRQELAAGEMAIVERLLGRPYQLDGEVVHGDGRGKQLGFPTANLEIWKERALPRPGVYAGWASVEGEPVPAVTNVGFRPTFDHQTELPRVETHLLDYERNLYGRQITLSFLTRLRDERRFESLESLVEQVFKDIRDARSFLEVRSHETVPGATPTYSGQRGR